MRLQRIVIGIDFSDASSSAAKWAAHSFAPDAELLLCHVVDTPEVIFAHCAATRRSGGARSKFTRANPLT